MPTSTTRSNTISNWSTCTCTRKIPRRSTNACGSTPTTSYGRPQLAAWLITARKDIKKNYLALFASAEGIRFEPLERFATPDRVVDDMWVRFRISGPGFENAPYPVGTKVKMRLVHIFHIRDGLISREMGYEGWSIDED